MGEAGMLTNMMVLGALTFNQWGWVVGGILCGLLAMPILSGAVFIQERQVGVIIKKFGSSSLAPGQLIALAGESGYQADTLPPGLHFGY